MLHKSIVCMIPVLLIAMAGCTRDKINILSMGNFRDTSGTLKSSADFPIGIAAEYGLMTGNSGYAATVKREAASVTFGNELKYSSVVQNNGSFNYATADNFYNICKDAGIAVYGHTLNWYQQNNTTYLTSIVGGSGGSAAPNLVTNGNFETINGGLYSGWNVFNPGGNTGGNGNFSVGSGGGAHGGASSMQANVTVGGTNWRVQISSGSFTTIPGHKYTVNFWVKAANAGGSEQVEIQYDAPAGTGAQYSGDMANSTSWSQGTFGFTAAGTTARVVFDMGLVVNTYNIDDVTVIDATAAAANAAPTAIAGRVDSVMHLWIDSTVKHFAGRIKAWDVVNEPMLDGSGALRTSANAGAAPSAGQFYWSDYLGRQYALKAFQYAKAADPSALLFINEYNLESSKAKLDSLLAYIKELKDQGAQIDGIGTQMHISISTSYAGIDNAFQKLAATGLKVRVSELDVRVNPSNKAGFNALPVDPTIRAYQAEMYRYVVSSYIRNVPAQQRYGITVWGVNDGTSWIITSQKNADAPLLFDDAFAKKPAYSGFLLGLQSK